MEVISKRLALPGSLGRICPRLCEQECRRCDHDSGLAIGALRPTNTWDFPTYLILGLAALAYGLWRYLPVTAQTFSGWRLLSPLAGLPAWSKRLLITGGAMAATVPSMASNRLVFAALA